MIIGISGKLGVGKTTLSQQLSQLIDKSTILSFSDAIKREVAQLFEISLDEVYNNKNLIVHNNLFRRQAGMSEDAMTIRGLLQWYGTDVVKLKDERYWIRKMEENIINCREDIIIIDDVRYPDEADFVKEHDGINILINPYPEYSPCNTSNELQHSTEISMDRYCHWDYTFSPLHGIEHLVKISLFLKAQLFS